jgi:hypothetical protein
MGDDISILVERLKEALLLQNKEQAEDIRKELLDMLEKFEKVDKLV